MGRGGTSRPALRTTSQARDDLQAQQVLLIPTDAKVTLIVGVQDPHRLLQALQGQGTPASP